VIEESTDSTDTAQLAIFIRGIDAKYNITGVMASLVLQDTTKSRDLYIAVKNTLNRFSLCIWKLPGINTDGAPAMVGKKDELVKLLENDAITSGNLRMMKYP